ncbi:MAG TPA: ATP-dependent DNA helicase, partial [Acidimicrobiales bacterium]|nr:ATP-dependent DNA helicase [Acidimicrobiales bacterium]
MGDEDLADALHQVAATLPGGGEDRPGQLAMAEAVERAVADGRHLVVQAGTGTGKSLAYLLPLVRSGRKVVVATATKALQDQLAAKDLPQLDQAGGSGRRLRFAVLKGRSNYLCRQRVAEVSGRVVDPGAAVAPEMLFDDDQVGAAPSSAPTEAALHGGRFADQVRQLVAWADSTTTGDRADLAFEPDPRAWATVSVTARECPGAFRCPSGPDCFAEHARARAGAADIVVVNTHLYATHVASDGAVLPEHEVLVLDEAHAVEDVMTAGLGVELTGGRVRAAGQLARGLLASADAGLADGVGDTADRLEVVLRSLAGRRVVPSDGDLGSVLTLAAGRVSAMAGALRSGASKDDTDLSARRARALLATSHLSEDLAQLVALGPDQVAWVESSGQGGRTLTLRAAPVEVGAVLAERLWPNITAVLTSATIPPLLGERLGLPVTQTDHLDVGSPFPYRTHAVLYCPTDLPDRRSPDAEAAVHREIRSLAEAAGGRTLALFTSWRAMQSAVEALRDTLGFTVLAQNDRPKAKLLAEFVADESSCLFATMSFWQGVD